MTTQCRFCHTPLQHTFSDLGLSPIANDYVSKEQLHRAEKFYPLHTYVCEKCFLVQIEDFESPEHIFGDGDYAYFSSFSDSWLKHAKAYTGLMVKTFGFDASSQVIEIASNDGYLLQYFKEKGIPVLGVEPAANTAKVAEEKGIPSLVKFFGVETAKGLVADGKQADLLLGNNVLAHVPDLNDFVAGMKIVLKPKGIITMEFPHLLQLMEQNQFDTIYHEHYSYYSFLTVSQIFASHGITLFDVEEIPTHGGSLRVFGCKITASHQQTAAVSALSDVERTQGMETASYYESFQANANALKDGLLNFLLQTKARGKTVAGYGAAAKGNTLLNYAGIKADLLPFVVDAAPAKQNKFLPGSHIPVFDPQVLEEKRPDFVVILPWNIADEVCEQLAPLAALGTQFVTAVPDLKIR